jgi:hypothetical protein
MRTTEKNLPHLESRLASLLHFGTWLASALMGLGLPLFLVFGRNASSQETSVTNLANELMKVGIAVFILLPVVRVAFMLTVFARQRDSRFVAMSGLVLLIIAASALIGFISSTLAG